MSYAVTIPNVHNSKMDPVLLQNIQNYNVLFSVTNAVYGSQQIYEMTKICNLFSINRRKGEQIKNTSPRVLSMFA